MEWLNYHHLLYFWSIAKEGGLRQASEKLLVSQPSISSQVRQLEESLGEQLFRRGGRKLVLTEMGQTVFGYAEEIFGLGRELLNTVKQRPTQRALRLSVGIADSFPKLLSYEILKPVFSFQPAIHLVCREGKTEDLLGQLASHRLDAVLSDEPATTNIKFKAFSHLLGKSGVTFCAVDDLARALRVDFPQSLHDAPALLPTQNAVLRRSLEAWFRSLNIRPRILAEFEDGALMKVAAADGQGFIAVPTAAFHECLTRFQLQAIGTADQCIDQYYLITAERRVTHPGVALITKHAQSLVFS